MENRKKTIRISELVVEFARAILFS